MFIVKHIIYNMCQCVIAKILEVTSSQELLPLEGCI